MELNDLTRRVDEQDMEWAFQDLVIARLNKLEAKLDFLTRALEAGAIGRWEGMGPRP